MKHPEEVAFYAALRMERAHRGNGMDRVQGWEAARARAGITDKQAHYYAEKWSNAGWWDSGVSLRTGWFTPEAPAALDRAGGGK